MVTETERLFHFNILTVHRPILIRVIHFIKKERHVRNSKVLNIDCIFDMCYFTYFDAMLGFRFKKRV
jgi:hypothetical protein